MTTYTAIPTGDIDTDSPVTQPLMTALRDNPIATAEGSSGAPKFAVKTDAGSFSSAALDFNSVGAWSGVFFTCSTARTTGSTATVTMDATTDGGSSYLGAVTLATVPANGFTTLTGFLDFATGLVHGTSQSSIGAALFSQTISGASLSIDGIRFSASTFSSFEGTAIVQFNGGESAT